MEIKDILSPDCTRCAVPGTSKKRILQLISEIAGEHIDDLTEDDVLTGLMCREKMGSTGIGAGIAIPHGRLPHLTQPFAVVVTCIPGIEFDAIDNQPVDVFFAILVPSDTNEAHLQTLATVAKKLSDKEVTKHLRKANSNIALYELLI